jgi:phage FluMu gp28-like protein
VTALNGGFVGWFAPTYKLAGEAWREIVARLGPAATRVRDDDKRIELHGGGVVEVWTMDSDDPARGRFYDLVVIDEAGIVKGLTAIWQAAVRPTLTDRKGKALFLGTPKGLSGEFARMFATAERGDDGWAAVRAETVDNPWIDPEEIEAAKRELPEPIFNQEYRGIPADDGGNPFGVNAIREARIPLPKTKPVVYGIDLARAADFTVIIGLDAMARVCHVERFQAPWIDQRRRILATVSDTPCVVDATGVGDAIVEDLQTMGVIATAFKFTQPSKMALMQRLITAFQTRFVNIPVEHEHQWLTGELEMFGYTFTPNGVKYEAPRGMHDDGVMALGLAMYGWDRVQCAKPLAIADTVLVPDDRGIALAPLGRQIEQQFSQLPAGF